MTPGVQLSAASLAIAVGILGAIVLLAAWLPVRRAVKNTTLARLLHQ